MLDVFATKSVLTCIAINYIANNSKQCSNNYGAKAPNLSINSSPQYGGSNPAHKYVAKQIIQNVPDTGLLVISSVDDSMFQAMLKC